MNCYERGTTITLYANFLTLSGAEATTVSDAKITIRHIDSSNVLVVDINEAFLTHGTETMYFYKWAIDDDADLGEYTVEYQATVDGDYAEANETIKVTAAIETVPLTSSLYTTAEDVAEYLGVDVSQIKDIWLEWASRYIDLYTNRIFHDITVTDKYDITESGQNTLFLDNFPVISVTEVKNDEDIMPTTDYLVYEKEGIIKIADDFVGNIYNVGAFIFGRQKVEVTYKYGELTVPKEISWAATVLAAQIAYMSLVQAGIISAGAVTEEEIGEYRRRRDTSEGSSNFSNQTERSKIVGERLEEDVFSAKNVLRIYRVRKMRAV